MFDPIARPDGRLYRPRKLVAYAVTDDDDLVAGAVVFGTHDPARAADLAQQIIDRDAGHGYTVASPCPVWWRDGFNSGKRCWVEDQVRGRAGVWFREIVESAPTGP